ncbi:hypothetical protein A3K86_20790 [Photobacterium jeanii]|uniref:Secreted protein n=1 Tax=Photobacterium jeanii TaxID=858640 RepID=A0A178K353_9GAMM|nr:hypothetical protein [Photobacterium jeanii]OAN11385.1 hypothetical protein A3K86_20790 [Photobacterium jeanii]PST90906.1 hypothetical protein C9I91_09895 [Photobacterium jeanii]
MRKTASSLLIMALLSGTASAAKIDFSCAGTCDQTILCEILSEGNASDFDVKVTDASGIDIAGGQVNEYLEFEFPQPENNYGVLLFNRNEQVTRINGSDINVPCKCKCPPKD